MTKQKAEDGPLGKEQLDRYKNSFWG